MQPRRLVRLVATACAFLVAGWGCQSTDAVTTPEDTPSAKAASPEALGRTFSSVRYAMSLSYGRAKKLAEGGFSVTTDGGYEVTITSGYLVSYSASLVHCPKKTGSLWPLSLGIRSARAGHSGVVDPSAMVIPHVESLGAPSTLDLAPIVFPEAQYCKIHYLVARANDSAVGTPEGVDMKRVSLRLKGHYRAPGAAEDAPLDLSTSAANGAVTELGPLLEGSTCKAGGRLDVTIERDLGTLFDGAELGKTPHGALEHRLLQNLIENTRVTATCTSA